MAAPNKIPIIPIGPTSPIWLGEQGLKGIEKLGGSIPGVKQVVGIAGFFTDPVRVGEAVVGLIMLAVGINAALKGGPANAASAGYRGSDYAMQANANRAAKKSAIYKAAKVAMEA